MIRSLLILTMVLCWGKAPAVEPEGTGSLVEEESQEVIAALEENGQALVSSGWFGQGWGPEIGGRWRWQHRGRETGAMTTAHGRVVVGGLQVRGRARWVEGHRNETTLTGSWRHGDWVVAAGGIGAQVGLGLLLAGPGRGASATAGVALPKASFRLRNWGVSPDQRTLQGVGLHGGWGQWRLLLARGQNDDGAYQLAGAEVPLGPLVCSFGRVQGPGASGSSLSARGALEGLTFHWEMAGITERESPTRHIWAAGGRWDGGRFGKMEFEVAGGDGDGGASFGRRPAALMGHGGRGWVWRGTHTRRGGWALRWLVARSRTLERGAQVRQGRRSLLEAILDGPLGEFWHLECRWRMRSDQEHVWDLRYPWLPAALSREELRANGSLKLIRDSGRERWLICFRQLATGSAGDRESRHLLEVRHEGTLKGPCRVRLGHGWAWGDDVDLVTVVAPASGVILPRHWGRWQTETSLGLAWKGSRWMGSLALAYRVPERGEEAPAQVEYWLSTNLLW